MNIYQDIDGTLTTLNVPFFCGEPTFEEEPETYIIYHTEEEPALFADGDIQLTEYGISLDIFSTLADADLYNQIKIKMQEADWQYEGGFDVPQIDKVYPIKKQYHMEFIK